MIPDVDDTIAAIATAGGGAARGIVRATGPRIAEQLAVCFHAHDGRSLLHACGATVIAGDILAGPPLYNIACELYFWPNERSYTRQPSAEIHTFGSPPLLDGVLRTLCDAGMRLAAPGEFTMRAFLAGRLDLTEAEAVLGVIDARDRCELNVALTQLAGGVSRPLHRLREELLETLAHLEAGLDFVDEDIEFISHHQLDQRLAHANDVVEQLLGRLPSRQQSSGLLSVVFCGRPNVGKSSLINALAGCVTTLVADGAGTTRDYVTQCVDLLGWPCLLIDTAGIDASAAPGSVEGQAQELARQQLLKAQVQVLCLEATGQPSTWEREQLIEPLSTVPRVIAWTKIDLSDPDRIPVELPGPERPVVVATSARTGAGIERLRAAIRNALPTGNDTEAGVVSNTAVRCWESLRGAGDHLQAARQLLSQQQGEELVAFELRMALQALGSVVGAVFSDDILDRIFSRFCIGK